MKKKTLIWFACLMSLFIIGLSPTLAQQQERPIIRLIYFVPRDRKPQPDINAKMDELIKNVQLFYAEQMENHGFDRKTIKFETDKQGNAVVHHIKGKHNEAHYHKPSWVVWDELRDRFDLSKNMYLTALDISPEVLDSAENTDENGSRVCGRGGSQGNTGGAALIPASGHCFNISVTAHELGHSFGLQHDYTRNDGNWIPARGVRDKMMTSYCAAEWLDLHSAFNPGTTTSGEWATTEMLPPSLESSPNAIRLRFEVTDPDGIHQVQLHTPALSGVRAGFSELIGFKQLSGNDRTVEFVTTNLTPKSERVSLLVMDVNGNFTYSQAFPVNITPLLPRPRNVSIPDRNLAAAVREEIDNSITTHSLLNLTSLDVRNRGIRNLKGLEHAHNLKLLNLSGEYIEDEQRVVNSNKISDFSPLEGLKQLTWLKLANLGIINVSPFANFTQLTSLELSSNAITDVSPLENLTQLDALELHYNAIVDISSLENMTHLTWLGLDGNTIFDMSPLVGMIQLGFLSLSNNAITDISALENLTHLTWLNLGSNTISDISPLENLTQLTWLSLGRNTISDVTPLENMTQLKELYFSDNTVSDISPLANMTQLGSLSLANNAITDLSILSELTQLTWLDLVGNTISDIAPLVQLKLQGRQWDSTGLRIQHNPLSYISINKHISAMQAKGIEIQYDTRTPTTLTKRLGDEQHSKPGIPLASPLVVEVKDERGVPFAGVPVTFTVTAGDGKVRPDKAVSDTTGRAQTKLTLGADLVKNTVRVKAAKIKRTVIFTATATDNPPPTFRKPITFSVAENTTAVGKVKATDVDNQDRVTRYSIRPTAGEDSKKFSITPTGVLRFKTPPDFERPTTASRTNEYIVLVSATSGTGDRTRTGTHPFIITVTDVDEPPDAPTAPTVIPATPTSLIVSWIAPENSGPSMTYEVRYREGNTGKFINANYNGKQTNFTLKGLTRGKKYHVRVQAKNGEGTSAWSTSGIGIPKASPPIDFPDTALRTKIAVTLGKRRNASITPVDMLALTEFEAPNAKIRNLTGLEHAHNLKELDLGGEYVEAERKSLNSNTISDFSPIAGLTQLTRLNLSYCSLSDVSFLSNLTHLTSLRLYYNTISDISPLTGLTQLTFLELTNNNISDVSSLAGLTQLERLFLFNTAISDISALSSLTELVDLGLSSTSVSDVSPLKELTQLTNLYLSNNNISDISPLADLTQLKYLYLSSNSLTDVSPLSGLTQLTVLQLHNNGIRDVSPLVGLNLTGTKWNSTGLNLERNPLSYASINTHIPAIQAKGVEVQFDTRTPTTLVKISGAAQQGIANEVLPLPLVVEVRDQQNRVFSGVPVTFTVTAGNGKLRDTTTITDTTGKADTRLTLGRTAGTTTVRVKSVKVSQPVQFTATAILLSSPVTVRDTNLRVKIADTLGKRRDSTLTAADMLKLTTLMANSANIRDLTGLQHASNLTTLSLENNNISDLTPITALTQLETLSLDANILSDVTPIEGLTQLTNLSLDSNRLSDVFSLTGLSELENLSLNTNNISDVAPLTALTQLNTLQLKRNPLSYPSLHTSIPTIQANGASVIVDPRTPTTLVKISGTHGVAGASLPVIVEVQDEQGLGFAGVPVAFTVTTGRGHLSSSNVITDTTGRARTTYTLGATPGKNTIRVTAVEIREPTLFTITAVDANSRVSVRDANLRAKIAETLGKPQNVQLTAGDMLALTRLEAPNANIQDLTGLEHARNLTRLDLGGEYISGTGWVNSNNVSDFSPLFELAQLTDLDLSFNSLTDVSFLSDMPQLTRLELYNNEISDISVFSSLTRLTSLRLGSNVISDASPLAGLTQLTDLDLSGASISDVSPLSGLTQLRRLYLYGTMLSDVSALSSLTQLTSLGMSSTTLSDISPLAGLTQLTYLYLGWSVISDISALAGLTQITALTLSGNSITDVSPLAELTQLEVLYLNRNGIIDVSPLGGLELPGTQWNSTGLYIERNPLNYASVNTHIPAMQARGVEIEFDNQAHSALVRVSGDAQEGEPDTTLPTPLVIKAMDPHGAPIKDRIIRFYLEAEDHVRVIRVTTDANGKAETTIKLGPNPGLYRIRVAGEDITYPVFFTATATGAAQLAAVVIKAARLPADVNGDGTVNIQDLVLVSSNFGQTGKNNADVNSDGVVNISDLVLVAGSFGGAASAPAMHPSMLAKLSRADIQHWLDEAKQLGKTDAVYLRGIMVLEQLLIALIPKETGLLANYPNPFNPETWIPYQLATPSEVTLHIYAVNGALVRTLALGHQAPGMYHSKSRAAYWDGRNAQGERVASGIYFYTLSAGNFAATRKMLIRK